MEPRILVVDDDPSLRSLLTDAFVDVGYRVQAATDGLEALSVAERDQPDLVVADVAMPNLDGASLAVRLRARGTAGCRASRMWRGSCRCELLRMQWNCGNGCSAKATLSSSVAVLADSTLPTV